MDCLAWEEKIARFPWGTNTQGAGHICLELLLMVSSTTIRNSMRYEAVGYDLIEIELLVYDVGRVLKHG